MNIWMMYARDSLHSHEQKCIFERVPLDHIDIGKAAELFGTPAFIEHDLDVGAHNATEVEYSFVGHEAFGMLTNTVVTKGTFKSEKLYQLMPPTVESFEKMQRAMAELQGRGS